MNRSEKSVNRANHRNSKQNFKSLKMHNNSKQLFHSSFRSREISLKFEAANEMKSIHRLLLLTVHDSNRQWSEGRSFLSFRRLPITYFSMRNEYTISNGGGARNQSHDRTEIRASETIPRRTYKYRKVEISTESSCINNKMIELRKNLIFVFFE